MPAIAVYVRVSTTGQNIDGQRREIERWLKGNMGDGEEVRSYIDKASANNRPACIVAAVSTTVRRLAGRQSDSGNASRKAKITSASALP